MIDMTFKTKKEREEQMKSFKSAQSNFKVFGQVGPYYLTWLLLTFYRIEVSNFSYLYNILCIQRNSSFNILIIMIVIIFIFEMQMRMQYGSG